MSEKIRWGIIGPGSIAKEFTDDLPFIKEQHHFVKAIVGHRKETTERYLEKNKVDLVFYSVEELIDCKEVDCVYIATPHPNHYKSCLQLLESGIPVLCEKPLAMNGKQVSDLIKKSEQTQTFLMEGMWIRCLPSIIHVLEIIESGIIGKVNNIESRMTYKAPYDEDSRYFNPEKGGGSLLDLGIYPAYLSYLILGKPHSIKAAAKMVSTGIDGGVAAIMTHAGGAYSIIESSLIKKGPNDSTIYGDKGSILITEPWNEMPEMISTQIYNGPKQEYKPAWEGKGLYFEVIEMMKCLQSSKTESSLLSHQNSLELVQILDEIRLQTHINILTNSRLYMELKIIATNIGFGEGPVWHPDGYLLFSDVLNNRILKLHDGKTEVFLENSGLSGNPEDLHHEQIGANGLAIDKEGNILMCQHGNHAIAKLTRQGDVQMIIDHYNGRRLNSPNDLCIGPEGEIIFSDPPYGLKDQELIPEIAQPKAGVYKWHHGNLELLFDELEYPNGVCFSPDFKYLFVGTNKPEEKGIRRFTYSDGKISDKQIFIEENADGIKSDRKGNLYLATMQGIKIVSSEGEVIRKIETPEMATNLCLHEPYMYITTESVVYEYYLPNLAL